MTVRSITTLLVNILSGSRYYPFMVQLLVGGMDKKNRFIYSLDPVGGVIEEKKAVATGSGSPFAYGVLEDRYVEGLSLDDGVDLAIRALHQAMKRDSASGNGVHIVKITPDEYIEVGKEYIEAKRLELS